MEVHGRNFGAFWSNRLKKDQLSQDRFIELDRSEEASRLDRLADVRSSVVTHGRSLIANPNYPDGPTLASVSRLLAHKLAA